FKPRYAPNFPTVRILQCAPFRITSPAQLQALGLIQTTTASNPAPPPRRVSSPRFSKAWPDYQRCLRQAPVAHRSDEPDVSRADFTFCLIAIDWGWSVEETAQRLSQLSRKARQNGEAYTHRTAYRAAAAVARRGQFAASGRPEKSVEKSEPFS